jgi:hypothetical protein
MILRGYVWYTRKRKQGLDDLFMGIAWVCSLLLLICLDVTYADWTS